MTREQIILSAPTKALRNALLERVTGRARALRKAGVVGRVRTEKISPTRFYLFGRGFEAVVASFRAVAS